jgi:hypothetical protein
LFKQLGTLNVRKYSVFFPESNSQQGTQDVKLDDPSPAVYLPKGHNVQFDDPISEKVPREQKVHLVIPESEEKFPAEQLEQLEDLEKD